MAIPIIQEEKPEKRKISIPFWVVWVIIPLIILGGILYFTYFQKIPESEIILDATKVGMTEKDFEEVDKILTTMQKSSFKDLTPVISNFSYSPSTPIIAVPPGSKGRPDPFAPVQ